MCSCIFLQYLSMLFLPISMITTSGHSFLRNGQFDTCVLVQYLRASSCMVHPEIAIEIAPIRGKNCIMLSPMVKILKQSFSLLVFQHRLLGLMIFKKIHIQVFFFQNLKDLPISLMIIRFLFVKKLANQSYDATKLE